MTNITNSDDKNILLSANVSPKDFLGFGMGQVAYVRQIIVMNKPLFAVHAADGTPLSVFDTQGAALDALAQNDLDPVQVH